jgi:hypothetical protein
MDQPAMPMTVKGCDRLSRGEVPAVMGGRSRLGDAHGQKTGGRKAGQEAKPTR